MFAGIGPFVWSGVIFSMFFPDRLQATDDAMTKDVLNNVRDNLISTSCKNHQSRVFFFLIKSSKSSLSHICVYV